MSFNFPPTPAIGQEITAPNGVTYGWDGVKWFVVVASGGGGGNRFMEALTVTAVNTLSSLTHVPIGDFIELVVNGQTFLPVGTSPPFELSGKSITWLNTIYSLNPGDNVAVAYTYLP
jgi:hypothetical protein